MSQHFINAYLNELDTLKKVSGVLNEQVVREAFKDMLKGWAKQDGLVFVAEHEYQTKFKTKVYPDGTILHNIRVPLGYWEAKDTKDDLDEEIAKKTAKGYPQDNIIYENGHTAVLIQNKAEIVRCDMTEPKDLLKLVTLFFDYERPRSPSSARPSSSSRPTSPPFWKRCAKRSTRPMAATPISSSRAEIPETREGHDQPLGLGSRCAGDADPAHPHRGNFRACLRPERFPPREQHREGTLCTGGQILHRGDQEEYAEGPRSLLRRDPRSNAAVISSHHEKQGFLKAIYENFYKVYNPKAADRLGVVYTPNEIVKIHDRGGGLAVQEALRQAPDRPRRRNPRPRHRTGTFICELLEYFRGQPQKLLHKYKNELHANEVAILPYYVANLNIEATYAAISGQFAEFPPTSVSSTRWTMWRA